MQTPRQPLYIGMVLTGLLVLVGLGGLVWVMAAKTEPTPEALRVPQAAVEKVAFDVAPFDRVCRQFVNEVGLVDYEALKASPADLEAFLQQVRQISPHSNLAAFTTKEQALAYWLNAYNAWMMHAVVQAYPIKSVNDIDGALNVFNAKGRVCGGEDLSLDAIENAIVRQEFVEPRVHFALNCASMGCPWLPQEAFQADRLDQQLDREARRFFLDPMHFRIDTDGKTARLSQILNWYAADFLKWLVQVKHLQKPTIMDFVRLYAPPAELAKLKAHFQIKYQEYDWRLIDQKAAWAGSRKQPEGRR